MWARIKRLLSNKTIMLRFAFTLVILLVFRIVSYIPVPLYNTAAINQMLAQSEGFFAILNSFTGQALERFSILALGISPYITASIIIQLLQMVLPSVKEIAETGEAGKAKLNRWTRILAVILAFIQGYALILGTSSGPGSVFYPRYAGSDVVGHLYMALTIAAGTAFSIFIADMVTKRGIGNGTSLLIVAGIVTSIPTMFSVMWQYYIVDKTNGNWSYAWFVIITLLYFAILLAVVFMESAQRKIPIQYANRQGKSDANVPIKLNSAGVIPVIFASTILSIPMTVAGFFSQSVDSGAGYWVNQIFGYTNPIGFILYVILIVIFSFFYAFLQIDPGKIADNLSKSHAFIPGVRPGEDTKDFIAKLLFKVTIIGTIYLVILAVLPILTSAIFGLKGAAGQAIILGGTSLLIVVGVAIETAQQLESDAEQDEYKGIF